MNLVNFFILSILVKNISSQFWGWNLNYNPMLLGRPPTLAMWNQQPYSIFNRNPFAASSPILGSPRNLGPPRRIQQPNVWQQPRNFQPSVFSPFQQTSRGNEQSSDPEMEEIILGSMRQTLPPPMKAFSKQVIPVLRSSINVIERLID